MSFILTIAAQCNINKEAMATLDTFNQITVIQACKSISNYKTKLAITQTDLVLCIVVPQTLLSLPP